MTPEDEARFAALEEELMRMRAWNYIQSSDTSALLLVLEKMQQNWLLDEPSQFGKPQKIDIVAELKRGRSAVLERMLTNLETKNPGLAARLQALIDVSCKNFPFNY